MAVLLLSFGLYTLLSSGNAGKINFEGAPSLVAIGLTLVFAFATATFLFDKRRRA